MSRRPEPKRVVILGHSYVRCLFDFIPRTSYRRNLGFHPNDVDVSCVHLSRATLRAGRRCIQHLMQDVRRRRPYVVYVHVGENDVNTLTADQLAYLILNLQRQLDDVSVLVISQLLPLRRLTGQRWKIVTVNEIVNRSIQNWERTVYWKHRSGFWAADTPTTHMFADDRVHLSAYGLDVYWHSVSAAVGGALCRV